MSKHNFAFVFGNECERCHSKKIQESFLCNKYNNSLSNNDRKSKAHIELQF
jgi:hypothetical protein